MQVITLNCNICQRAEAVINVEKGLAETLEETNANKMDILYVHFCYL